MSTDVLIPARSRAIALSGGDYRPEIQLKHGLRRGMIIVAVLVFGLGGLAAFLPMTGAVIAIGAVSVANYVKMIGHPTGGVIADVLVRDGDHVRAGQTLMRLDSTVTGASAQYTGENVDQLLARAARLQAERDDSAAIRFAAALTSRARDPNIAALMQEERRSFELRRSSRLGLVAQLRKRIAQTQQEISGYDTQSSSYARQAGLIGDELKVTRELYNSRYTTLDRLNALERSAVGLTANADSARTSSASAGARIAELQAQIDSVQRDARSNAATELMDTQTRISELKRLKVTADDSFGRAEIKAPVAGVIDKLAFKTIGGIVPPGETILELVPDNDRMVVEVRVPLTDIDQLRIGQPALLRFSAFSQRTTPEIAGKITHVAADRTVEQQSGIAYYRATIGLDKAQIDKLGAVQLKPGMPVEAFIQTGDRTMLNYILKPMSDQLRRAFREG